MAVCDHEVGLLGTPEVDLRRCLVAGEASEHAHGVLVSRDLHQRSVCVCVPGRGR